MFTGLVELLATVSEVLPEPPGRRLVIHAPTIAAEAAVGASIAVNGCCLTATNIDAVRGGIRFEAGPETLSRTTLGQLSSGDQVNLERSLVMGGRLGGHLVTGHVDGIGTVQSRSEDGQWVALWFAADERLTRQMASKGSIAIDGVSLTLVEVEDHRFSVALIPHTLSMTTLGRLQVGDRVNLETDLLAKYVQRQLATVNQSSERKEPQMDTDER